MRKLKKQMNFDDVWAIAFMIFIMSAVISMVLMIVSHLTNPWDDNLGIFIAPFLAGSFMLIFVTLAELCPDLWNHVKRAFKDIFLEEEAP